MKTPEAITKNLENRINRTKLSIKIGAFVSAAGILNVAIAPSLFSWAKNVNNIDLEQIAVVAGLTGTSALAFGIYSLVRGNAELTAATTAQLLRESLVNNPTEAS